MLLPTPTRLMATLTWVLLALLPADLLAHPDVDAATRAYGQGKLARALAACDRAEKSLTIQEADLVAVRVIRGAALLAGGKRADAETAFRGALQLSPLHEPSASDIPPDVMAIYREVQAAHAREHGATVAEPTVNGADVSAALGGAHGDVTAGILYVKAPSQAAYSRVPLARTAGETRVTARVEDVELWKAGARDGTWLLVVEAHNARGVPWARAGSAQAPLSMAITSEMSVAALAALAPPPAPAPPPPPAAAPPPAPVPAHVAVPPVVAAAEERSPSALPSLVVLGAGGVGVAGGLLLGLAAAAVASGAGLVAAYSYQQLLAVGVEATGNRPAFIGGYVGGLGTAVGGALGLALAVLVTGGAAVAVAAGVVMRVM